MARIHKVELYIVDINDFYSENTERIVEEISDRLNVSLKGFDTQCKEVDWDDDIDINFTNANLETYRKYFE